MEDKMKMKRVMFPTIAALLTGLILSASNLPARAQSSDELSAFIGRWQNNTAETKLNRTGPNGKNTPRGATYTFILADHDQGLHLDVYNEYPQPTPSRSMDIVTDRAEHPCTGSCIEAGGAHSKSASVQTYAYYPINSHMMARLGYTDGKISEYLIYAVSSDGKTLSMINWNPETPNWQNMYIFNR